MAKYLCLHVLLLTLCIMSVSEGVFVSIDCGTSSSFTDENSITWKGDSDMITNGVTHVVQSKNSISHVMDTLRVFTTRKKNCYSIEAEEGGKVLVRAGFNYGNYDKKSTPPMFDLLFDGNFWVTVNSSDTKIYEAIYVVKRKVISVCVAQTNSNQFPFISTLEVRSLDSQMYNHIGSNYALFMNIRIGYAINQTIRFPKDPYDRMWAPAALSFDNGLLNVTNNALINVDVPNKPPPTVLQNAIETPETNQNIDIQFTISEYPISYPVYINWYFSEVKNKNSNELRAFRILKDNLPFSLPIVPRFGNVIEYFMSNLTITPSTNFSLSTIGESTLPVLINAVELYSISDALTDGTNKDDVEGLASLQSAFGVLQEWGGDPCLPAAYSWEWIKCSNDPIPRVTSINLNSFNLSGSLPEFSSMVALEIIDFHNNSLTGPVPKFLGTLPNLKQLNLADNNFSGSIPRSLSRNSNLKLLDTGNTLLCTKDKSCKSKMSRLPIILGITALAFFIFGAIISVLVIMHNRREAGIQPSSGVTGHREDGPRSDMRGMNHDNFDDKRADERFYSSPTPLLNER